MKVWIDLHNSPHPLLFAPIVRRLEELGHEVALTARDNAQTVELARSLWPDVTVLGGPSPAGRLPKIAAIAQRMRDLYRWAASARPAVALSHNSYAQLVAARWLRIPGVTAMDYEHQPANHLAFRAATRILIPASLAREAVRCQGASAEKTESYPGLKEEIYLGDFTYDPGVLAQLGIDRGNRHLVVTRPPPTGAAYHQFENTLYPESLRTLSRQESVVCVVLARTATQRDAVRRLGLDNLVLPDHALDSRSLMYAADLVVGAGGTMTREAALLGVPTYSIFAGRPSAVDTWLEQAGMMRRLEAPEDLAIVAARPSDPVALEELRRRSHEIVDMFARTTLNAAR